MILVTGSTGFVGRSLMRALENSGQPARGYVGRINDPYALRDQLAGIETVIHLASSESTGKIRSLQHVDVEGTERLLEEAERAHINHIVFVSRLGADPNAMYAVLRAKGTIERLVRSSRIPNTIIRSATLFGRRDRFLNAIASMAIWSSPFMWLPAGGESVLQPLWVEDLVRCLIAVSDPLDLKGYRGKTFTVAGEERFRYDEIVRMVLAAAGLKRRIVPVRMRLMRIVIYLFYSWRQVTPITRFFLDRLAVPETVDLDVVVRTFGFRPQRMSQHMTYLRQPRLQWRVFN